MGTLFSTFDIARSGLQAAQLQIEIAGHNIANVNREGYSRQRAELVCREPLMHPYGSLGRGVEVASIERMRMMFLDEVYRQQAPALGSAEVRASYFARMEDLFQEPGDNGFGTQLDSFFDALQDFSGNVEEQPVRMSVLTEAQNLAASLNLIASQVYTLRTNANEEVRNMVPEINSLAERIAALNGRITDAEAGGGMANDLRDERDLLLDQLSSYVNITSRERTSGQVDVIVGNDALVEGTFARQLIAQRDPSLDPDRVDLVRVQFADSGLALSVESGRLYGALSVRDVELVDLAQRMDRLASTIISEINAVHANANGTENWSGTVFGSNAVDNAGVPLVSAGLPFDVQAGTLRVSVYNSGGARTTYMVGVSNTTTLQDLANVLNGLGHFNASVTADNRLQVGADAGYSFSFSDDTSGALVALGVNGLFTGTKASDIAVNGDVLADPRLLASGYSLDVLDTGDNSAALAMANVRTAFSIEGVGTIGDYYESAIVQVGVRSRANEQNLRMQQSFVDDFNRRRQEVSGVSIDEEVTYMLQFQRAYEASARVISVVDRMIESLLNAFA